MKILFLSTWFPYPPDNGSKLRAHYLLRALAARHDVRALAFCPSAPGTDEHEYHAWMTSYHRGGRARRPIRHVNAP